MKEFKENTIDQIRTLLRYLIETDLLNNKEVLRFLDVIAKGVRKILKNKTS